MADLVNEKLQEEEGEVKGNGTAGIADLLIVDDLEDTVDLLGKGERVDEGEVGVIEAASCCASERQLRQTEAVRQASLDHSFESS